MKRILLCLFLTACSSHVENLRPVGGFDSSGNEIPPVDQLTLEFSTVQRYVINPYCLQCHQQPSLTQPPLRNYQDVRELIVPQNPDQSELVQSLWQYGGRMPKNAPPIPERAVQLLRAWIESGAPETPPVVAPTPGPQPNPAPEPPKPEPQPNPAPAPDPTPQPQPVPEPSPQPTPPQEPPPNPQPDPVPQPEPVPSPTPNPPDSPDHPVFAPTYAAIQARTLNTYCTVCHGDGGSEPRLLEYEDLFNSFLIPNLVVPGKPEESELYKVLIGPRPRMPKRIRGEGGPRTVPEPAKDAIAEWIRRGAKND
jgi:outer membrane biosynthesis protein TonB